MKFAVSTDAPTQKKVLLSMEEKMQDSEFLGDTQLLLRNGENYDLQKVFLFSEKN